MLKEKSEFREKRLAFRDGPEVLKGSAENSQKDFLDLLVREGIVKPDVFQDNPLLGELKVEAFEPNDLKISRHTPGEITFGKKIVDYEKYIRGDVNVSDGSELGDAIEEAERVSNLGDIPVDELVKDKPKLTINGLAYAALRWPEIKVDVMSSLKSAGLNDGQLENALNNAAKYEKVKDLIMMHAKNLRSKPGYDKAILTLAAQEAVAQINVDAKTAETGSTVARYQLKARLDKEKARREAMKNLIIPHDVNMPKPTTLQLQSLEASKWLVAAQMREAKIMPAQWDINSPEGLAAMRYDFGESMGIMINDAPWVGMFNELAKASDNNFLNSQKVLLPEHFRDPVKFEKELNTNGQESFVVAYKAFMAFKDEANKIVASQTDLEKNIGDKDRIPVVSTVIDEVKSNVSKFTDAIRTKDWATAAIYIAGIWGAYKIYKNHGDGTIGKFIGKALPWIAVGGLGLTVAKNAGVDLLKMAGMTGGYSDFNGNLIRELFNVKGVDISKVDSDVLLDASQIKLGDLWKAYSNPSAPNFIDPMAADSRVFGEKFGGLTIENRDYKRTGEQLYILMAEVKKAYDLHMRADNGDRDFSELMAGEHGTTYLHDFMAEVSKYAHRKLDEKGATEVNKRIGQVLNGHHLNPTSFAPAVVGGEEVLAGSIAGYPVVLVAQGLGYRIYDRAEFEAGGLKGSKSMLAMPSEGEVDAGLKGLTKQFAVEVKERAKAVIEPSLPTGVTGDDLNWSGSHWEYEKAVDQRFAAFGVSNAPVQVKVNISYNGKVEHLETAGGGADLSKKIIEWTKSSSLAMLQQSGAIKFVKFEGNDAVLDIAGMEIRFEAVGGAPAFKAGELDKLIADKKFKQKFLDLVKTDDKIDFKQKLAEIVKKLEGLDEESVEAVVKDLTGATKTDNKRGFLDKLSDGAFSEAQVVEMVKILEHQAANQLEARLSGSFKDLKEFDEAVGNYMIEIGGRLDLVLTRINRRDPDENMSADLFNKDIFEPMTESASNSKAYAKEFSKAYQSFYEAKRSFSSSSHELVRGMMEKFINYTAEIDHDPFGLKEEGYCDDVRKAIINDKAIKTFEEFKNLIASGSINIAPLSASDLGIHFDGYLKSKLDYLSKRYTLKTPAVDALKDKIIAEVKLKVVTDAAAMATKSMQTDVIEKAIEKEFYKHIDENTHGFYREVDGTEHIGDGWNKLLGGFASAADWVSKKIDDWKDNVPEEKFGVAKPLDTDQRKEMFRATQELTTIEETKTFMGNSEFTFQTGGEKLPADGLIANLEFLESSWKAEVDEVEKELQVQSWQRPELVDNPNTDPSYKDLSDAANKYRLNYAIASQLVRLHKDCYENLNANDAKVTDMEKLRMLIRYYQTKLVL
ncbi:hypothetical protein KA119_00240 [Candidatus Gracilibacteria bacterium]|nr:hypothetical protein [Candidatus Gracilibacteria bacterium]